jgi:hypothetical protein
MYPAIRQNRGGRGTCTSCARPIHRERVLQDGRRWPVTCRMKCMFGWMMIFAFLAILGAVMMAAAPAMASISFKMVTILFGALFLVSVLTQVVRRGRA